VLGRYFIDRPIFACVIAIVIVLSGALAISRLPVSQYPNVAPPRVFVVASYPGASAEAIENSVTQVLEQQLKGIDGLLYFDATSGSDGSVEIGIAFRQDVNPDTAQVQVQNKLQLALSRLPLPVQQQGLYVAKAQPDFLMVVALVDPTDQRSSFDLGDYLVSVLQDPVNRVDGVGFINIWGSPYAMRVWLDPYKLASFRLMPSDIDAAIKAQNTQVAAGEIGAQPTLDDQQLNATVVSQSRMQRVEEFCAIILKTETDGSRVRLCDVARVELGSEYYGGLLRLNGHPASGMALTLAPGANALATAKAVRKRIAEFAPRFPQGVEVAYPRDATMFVERSIEEVAKTLLEAVVLVVIVMYLFLQSWRATLIPAIAIPVVLFGTFGVLYAFGYSVNTLTLFGTVLAIGLLVDDAIVVVENVERLMSEEGLSPRAATVKSMGEISGALIGIALVLSAVFLPMAFFGGSTGVIYRQFSITIVSSMLLSVLVALTLSPALCATLLKPATAHASGGVGGFFLRQFARTQAFYTRSVGAVIARAVRFFVIYAALCGGLYVLMQRLPTGFLPLEDQGQAIVQFTLPVGATLSRTIDVSKRVEQHFMGEEGRNVGDVFTVAGFSFSGTAQSAGMGFIALKPWDERIGPENSAQAITQRATKLLHSVRDAEIFAITPPSIQGLGQTNGFTYELLDVAGMGRERLKLARDRLLELAGHDPRLRNVRYNGLEDTPQLRVALDHEKLRALGLSQEDVNSTLTAAWGGSYVNDFIDRGRVKRVYQQGDAPFRATPEDLGKWFVRSSRGVMTPFSAFATTRWEKGPRSLSRYNGLASFEIQGEAAPGYSSGEAMSAIEELTRRIPGGVGGDWSSLSYQERLSSGQASSLYAVSILVVFLCLAALYESWSIPLSVLLVIPLGVIGAVLGAMLRGLSNDVFFQVGLVTTIGLSAKNAILIVEFAEVAQRRGATAAEAAIAAARLRLRPILMTSLAFMAGVFPLAIATGAGANGRIAIGTGVAGGMFTATVLASTFVPMFFVVVRKLFGKGHAPELEGAGGVGRV
jgi:multidrug efflux pump